MFHCLDILPSFCGYFVFYALLFQSFIQILLILFVGCFIFISINFVNMRGLFRFFRFLCFAAWFLVLYVLLLWSFTQMNFTWILVSLMLSFSSNITIITWAFYALCIITWIVCLTFVNIVLLFIFMNKAQIGTQILKQWF